MTQPLDVVGAEIVATAVRISDVGLSVGTSGNVSGRFGGGFLITPSALPYDRMEEADLVEVGLNGEVLGGTRRPSSEWPFHAAVYNARSEVQAVVHAHPPYATALSCIRAEIPAFHYMVAIAGGRSIRCAGFAKPGSDALAAEAVAALARRSACLLANHGMISVGSSVAEAFDLALEVENLAYQYWLALQVGEPVLLSEAEMDVVLEQFEQYRTLRAGG